MPQVSVVVPNFNREALIGETLNNLLAQSLKPHEIIVVDDGSTDKSVEVIRSFGDKVTLIQQDHRGPGAARNSGWRMATGEFIQFQDSDDLLSLNKLETQARVMEETGADLVYGPFIRGYIKNGSFAPENVVLMQRPLPAYLPIHEWVLRGLSIVFQACLLRRTFLERLGGYREDLMPSEDSELLFRMGLNGVRLAFSPDVLTVYRLHQAHQITGSGVPRSDRLKDWAKMLLIVHAQLDARKVQVHRQTRWAAQTELWNTRQWLGRLKCDEPELVRQLKLRYSSHRAYLYRCTHACQRLRDRWRQRRYGSRWHNFYGPAALTTAQRVLLAKIPLPVVEPGRM